MAERTARALLLCPGVASMAAGGGVRDAAAALPGLASTLSTPIINWHPRLLHPSLQARASSAATHPALDAVEGHAAGRHARVAAHIVHTAMRLVGFF